MKNFHFKRLSAEQLHIIKGGIGNGGESEPDDDKDSVASTAPPAPRDESGSYKLKAGGPK